MKAIIVRHDGQETLIRLYDESDAGWPPGTVEVDMRPHSGGCWTPISILGGSFEVRDERTSLRSVSDASEG